MLTMGLILAAGTVYAAQVDLQGRLTVDPSVNPTFFFNIKIADVGSLANWDLWQINLTMTEASGGTGAKFAGWANLTSNPNYLFFGDSFSYQWALTDLTALGGDVTNSQNGVVAAVDDLLAQITIDVSSAVVGQEYSIALSPAGNNFYWDNQVNSEALTQFGATYTFQIVPIPGTALLLGAGLLGLLGLRRKRR